MNTDNPSTRPNYYAPPQSEVGEVRDEDGELERASRGVRLGAAVVDMLVWVVIVIPMFIGLGFDMSGLTNAAVTPFTVIGIGVTVIATLAWIGITIYFVHSNGQTIAKRLLGIKVVRSDGSRASLARIFWLRNFVNALPGGVPILGNFYFLIDSAVIFGDKQQCVHDMIADTIVVKA